MHYFRGNETACEATGPAFTRLADFMAQEKPCMDCIDALLRNATITLRQWCEMPGTSHLRRF